MCIEVAAADGTRILLDLGMPLQAPGGGANDVGPFRQRRRGAESERVVPQAVADFQGGPMDYYQGIVADYLTGDPTIFVKPECCIRLSSEGPLRKGEHWYCDILAISLREQRAYLCEVTYSQTLGALSKRLRDWAENWSSIRAALVRDNQVPNDWEIRPWLFVPRKQEELARIKVAEIRAGHDGPGSMADADVTCLEEVVPWLYRSPHGHTSRATAATQSD
jgi:hypothetical protein